MSSLNKLNFLKQKAHIKDIPHNWNLDIVLVIRREVIFLSIKCLVNIDRVISY